MNTSDIICAISTPPGAGGIAVARISGPGAIQLVDTVWKGKPLAEAATHTAHLGYITDTDGSTLDQALATVFRAPGSFTGQDTVEISVHGSRYIQRQLLRLLTASGARLAEPGEFTRLAFAAGHLDLAQAEAVADIIAADSRAAHRIAMTQMRGGYSQRLRQLRSQLLELASLLELELDFSEEDVEFASRDRLSGIARETYDEIMRLRASFRDGRAIRDGIPVAIVGATNAGKSSLLNTLLADNRAIVSDIHGTTRDTIEETIPLGDYTFRLIDTAGLRDTDDPIEQAGIERSREAIKRSSIAILVIDPTQPEPDSLPSLPADTHLIIAVNKADLHPYEAQALATRIANLSSSTFFPPNKTPIKISAKTDLIISAKTGQGIDLLKQTLIDIADTKRAGMTEDILVTNERHLQALDAAAEAMSRVISSLASPSEAMSHVTGSLASPPEAMSHIISSLASPSEAMSHVISSLASPSEAMSHVISSLAFPSAEAPVVSHPATHPCDSPHSAPNPADHPGIEAIAAENPACIHIDAELQNREIISGDLIAIDLREAIHHLAAITGEITAPDILATIFSRFCVGK